MKSVIISIRPEWCDLIARGEKTLEIRKSKPQMNTPFKCYIYCTKDQKRKFWYSKTYIYVDDRSHNCFDKCVNGMVIGEFVCDGIRTITASDFIVLDDAMNAINGSCISSSEVKSYAGWMPGTQILNCKDIYGWHISGLKIYDMPKTLSEFRKPCDNDLYCEECGMYRNNVGACGNSALHMTRPPQSWCYVEEAE